MSTNFHAVEDEDEEYWNGVFLGKRAGGWVFQIKWHNWIHHPDKPDHPYRNIDEFEELVEGKIIKDEYGRLMDNEEFIDMVHSWTNLNDLQTIDESGRGDITPIVQQINNKLNNLELRLSTLEALIESDYLEDELDSHYATELSIEDIEEEYSDDWYANNPDWHEEI